MRIRPAAADGASSRFGEGRHIPCSSSAPGFKGGNIFTDSIETALSSEAFARVTGRKVEDIEPCRRCAVRHFCGAPCQAEAHEMSGSLSATGAFCELYEEQARYALRVIADGKEEVFLWDDWDAGATTTFNVSTL